MIYKKLNKRYAVLSYLLVVCTLISSFSLPIFAQEVGEIVEEEPLDSIDMGTMPGSGEVDPLAYPPPPYEASVLNGTICGFQNKASAKFLTIDMGNTASGTNVYQYSRTDSTHPNAQVFYIQYLEKPGVFYIHALNTSGETAQTRLKYSPSAATSGTASNLQLMYMMPTENTDQWLIQPVGDGSYFKIVSYANQSLCITSYGTSNGTASGTSTTSAGNVYVSTYTGSDNQLWQIYSGWQPLSVYGENIKTTSELDVSAGSSANSFYITVDSLTDKVSWSSSNTNIATIGANGRITAIAPGTVTILAAVTHSSGSVSVYSAKVNVLFEEDIYMIKRTISGTSYSLFAESSTSLIGKSSITSYQTLNYGKQLWYFEYLNNGYFKIISLRIRNESTYTDTMALTATSSSTVALSAFNNLSSQLWKMDIVDGYTVISNKLYPTKYLNIESNSASLTSSSSNNLSVTKATIPDCYFSGTYNVGIVGNTVNIKVEFDSSLFSNGVLTQDMFDIVDDWENFNENINIYMPGETAPTNSLRVIFVANPNLNTSIFGQTTGYTITSAEDNDGNENWSSCKIELNTNLESAFSQLPEIGKMKTIAHEMGHVLKLRHPYNSGYGVLYKTGNKEVLALMNQKSLEENEFSLSCQGIHDIYALNQKWN